MRFFFPGKLLKRKNYEKKKTREFQWEKESEVEDNRDKEKKDKCWLFKQKKIAI